MIKVDIKAHNQLIKEVTIMGHAKFADYGKDIVCASVSAVVVTSINAIITLNEDDLDYEEKNNKIIIRTNNDNQITQKLLNNMLILLEDIKNDYPQNITIRNEEK